MILLPLLSFIFTVLFVALVYSYSIFMGVHRKMYDINKRLVELSQEKNNLILSVVKILKNYDDVSEEKLYSTILEAANQINGDGKNQEKILMLTHQLNRMYEQVAALAKKTYRLQEDEAYSAGAEKITTINEEIEGWLKEYKILIAKYNALLTQRWHKPTAYLFGFKAIGEK
ncbi:MAG: hypothetical protein EAZ55_03280 [Cytophagales bacterium]|nr:MAG: hypothetical protein EAZ55_03280 [Cytophagales bacterium]